MRINWCEEHQASGWGGGNAQFCHLHPFDDEQEGGNYPCRMVQMELTPVDPVPAPYDIEIPDFVNRHW